MQRELFNLGLTYKSRGYGVFCVPVGESNRPVAEGFNAKSNGKIIKQKGAQNVGNYYRYQVVYSVNCSMHENVKVTISLRIEIHFVFSSEMKCKAML